jgi:hypothetical protein
MIVNSVSYSINIYLHYFHMYFDQFLRGGGGGALFA